MIQSICESGLLVAGHPRNPSAPTDDGWFGDCRAGVYTGQVGGR